MKNGLKSVALLGTGIILGAALFSGAAAYAASGVLAERSPCRVFIDGKQVQIDAYLIDGRNYVQLRDIGMATNAMNVYWDGATAAIGEWPGYHLKNVAGGKTGFTAKYSSSYQQAADYCKPFIDGLAGKSDREKVREIAFYVCDRLTYDAESTSTPRTALVDTSVHKGNCMSYAHNFLFLCDMAGVPCVFVHSSTHQWNQVYVEGRWWNVDVSGTDAGDDTASRYRSKVLFEDADMQGRIFRQTQPEQTAFIKEVLVPGSTK